MIGVSATTSCRQFFKELNILTLASLYIMEVSCFIKKYCKSLEFNADVHNYNTRGKMDIHVQPYRTNLYKTSVINKGTKIYNKLPECIKGIDSYKFLKRELKSFLLCNAFYSVDEYLST
jgi:hypothetical protein